MRDIILLTGASGHLGSAMLRLLVEDWDVICLSRRPIKLSHLPSTLHDRVTSLQMDIKHLHMSQILEEISGVLHRKSTKLSGLVNNAYFISVDSPLDVSLDSCDSALKGLFSFHVNLILEIYNRDLFMPAASVINISSMYAKVSPKPSLYPSNIPLNPLLYGSMKAALAQSTRYLSSILGPKGIRVNSVSYGPFPSSDVQNNSPEFVASLGLHTHLGRVGAPEESAGVIRFLLSRDSSYITGSDISVDGGWTAW